MNRNTVSVRFGGVPNSSLKFKPESEADPDYNVVFEISPALDASLGKVIRESFEIQILQGEHTVSPDGLVVYKMNLDDHTIKTLLLELNRVLFKDPLSEN